MGDRAWGTCGDTLLIVMACDALRAIHTAFTLCNASWVIRRFKFSSTVRSSQASRRPPTSCQSPTTNGTQPVNPATSAIVRALPLRSLLN